MAASPLRVRYVPWGRTSPAVLGEAGGDGCEQLAVGEIVNHDGMSNRFEQDKTANAAAVFLVPGSGGQQRGRGELRQGGKSEGVDARKRAAGLIGREQPALT